MGWSNVFREDSTQLSNRAAVGSISETPQKEYFYEWHERRQHNDDKDVASGHFPFTLEWHTHVSKVRLLSLPSESTDFGDISKKTKITKQQYNSKSSRLWPF